ncbi:MAG: KUP/HAK/KT family potassium transporter [Legionellales bacterium]|jgi:KUP system potassium uptake protein
MKLLNSPKKIIPYSIAALGVVYGDIGTSVLYAMRLSLQGIAVNPENVLGVLSLIFWALILIVSVKYLCFILRADNDGEGGVLALFALLKASSMQHRRLFFLLGILGTGLLLGDGMLTPAISVMSAVEGLHVISPGFSHLVLPLTLIILVGLFFIQHNGTGKIGYYFGPIVLLWFIVIGVLGAHHIFQNLTVINAINPYYAYQFFVNNTWTGYALLGGVFLVLTGAEALYADLGHFGKGPIRLSWFTVALPALLLNYFGQGAHLLQDPSAISNPFYALAPTWFEYPLLILATLATIIASQAVISAIFSLTRQAILLDLYPRIPIIQTSNTQFGQIYVPQMNIILAIGTIALVIIFQSSGALANAYGIAVNLVMVGVTLMVMRLANQYWRWSVVKVIAVFGLFLIIELAFLGANLEKIMNGGWIPLLLAALAMFVMLTWYQGMKYLRTNYYMEKVSLMEIIKHFDAKDLNILKNTTSVFVTDPYDNSGGCFLHYLKLSHMIPEHVLMVSIMIETRPVVPTNERYKLTAVGKNIYRIVLHYGFTEIINIPEALEKADRLKIFPFYLDVDQVNYLVEITHILVSRRKHTLFFHWQEQLFAFLMRNAVLDIDFLHLPYNRTTAMGTYCEI